MSMSNASPNPDPTDDRRVRVVNELCVGKGHIVHLGINQVGEFCSAVYNGAQTHTSTPRRHRWGWKVAALLRATRIRLNNHQRGTVGTASEGERGQSPR